MKQTRRRAHEWEEIVSRWRASGLSAQAFAAQHELKSATLSWWGVRLGKQAKAKTALERAPKGSQSGFTQLRVVPATQSSGYIEIVSRAGLVVRAHGVVDEQALMHVLRVVSQC